jgi:hypothetical protein
LQLSLGASPAEAGHTSSDFKHPHDDISPKNLFSYVLSLNFDIVW